MILQLVVFLCIYKNAQSTDLPAWCYDPPGNDCSWYKECLVRQYPCEANNDSYAISFGDRICNDFTNQRLDFSEVGQRWIDTTKACLQRQYPCEANNDSYAISFGDRICNDFTNQRLDFSEVGQRWIDTTKACLQKQLTPVLTASSPMTCPEIQAFAFNTHAHCYSDPPAGTPSFCELPFSDWLRVTWFVKSSFVLETSKTASQVLQILGKCTSNLFG